MKDGDVHFALDQALDKTKLGTLVDKCTLADACFAFLNVLEERAGFLASIGIRAAQGAITKWKDTQGCA